ncbi:MAG: UPF0175 family protein [Sulfuricellaceae bacterium]
MRLWHERINREAAYGLFREGTISSGVAARWLGAPRVHFLLDAMRHGATLLDDSEDDFRRETLGTPIGECALVPIGNIRPTKSHDRLVVN